jgi:hypothetical protein
LIDHHHLAARSKRGSRTSWSPSWRIFTRCRNRRSGSCSTIAAGAISMCGWEASRLRRHPDRDFRSRRRPLPQPRGGLRRAGLSRLLGTIDPRLLRPSQALTLDPRLCRIVGRSGWVAALERLVVRAASQGTDRPIDPLGNTRICRDLSIARPARPRGRLRVCNHPEFGACRHEANGRRCGVLFVRHCG